MKNMLIISLLIINILIKNMHKVKIENRSRVIYDRLLKEKKMKTIH